MKKIKKKCVFCELVGGQDFINIEPLNPIVEGHRIVIPKEHVTDFTDDPHVTAKIMLEVAKIAKETGGSFNLITSKGLDATQSVFHLHVHLVPRRANDGLKLPWTGQKKLS